MPPEPRPEPVPDDLRHRPTAPGSPPRTFQARRIGLGPQRAAAFAAGWPRWGLSVHDEALGRGPRTSEGLLDTDALFGRHAPLVLEIGFGTGEATVAAAAADPGRDVLAVEVHVPGIAALLGALDAHGLTNVRVVHGDALELVRESLPAGCLDEVRAFFPDPWPKARHAKRRLVQPEHVVALRHALVVGGLLHVATDWPDYAARARAVLDADPGLVETPPPPRPTTPYERKALTAGRRATDLAYQRTS